MRTIRPFIAMIVVALAVGACAGAGASQGLTPVGEPAGGAGFAPDGGERAAASAAPGTVQGEDDTGSNAVGARDDAKIIRTGTIELEVKDVPTALRTARDAIIALGGYVGGSNTSNYDDKPSAQITYRVPVDRWEAALDILRSLNGQTTKVVTEQTEAVDVTGQVIDVEARIRNLRASETALQGIAAKATRISDVLEVEMRLTDVRGQIEQLTAQLEDLNDRAGYATLTAYFSTPIIAVEAASSEWQPATTVDEAAASLISILQNVASAGIWFLIVWLPILLVLGLVAAFGVWLARRLGFRRPRAATLPPPPPLPGGPLATGG
jgi:hypothetical protein